MAQRFLLYVQLTMRLELGPHPTVRSLLYLVCEKINMVLLSYQQALINHPMVSHLTPPPFFYLIFCPQNDAMLLLHMTPEVA